MQVSDGFDAPVGSVDERASHELWPPGWYSVNTYDHLYEISPGVWCYHTGDDLNMAHDGDAHKPIYSAANGQVICARRIPAPFSSWGNLIVIQHQLPDGTHVYSRYGHVETILVKEGQEVVRGEMIAHVGNAFGRFAYHLHFDISTDDSRLAKTPWDWPGLNRSVIHSAYVSPSQFIQAHRPAGVVEPVIERFVVQSDTLRLRLTPSQSGQVIKSFTRGTVVAATDTAYGAGITWRFVTIAPGGELGWMAQNDAMGNIYLVPYVAPTGEVPTPAQPKGYDVSSNNTVDTRTLKADFIFVRATLGTKGVDKRFKQRREALSIPFGAYHIGTGGDIKAQVDNLIAVAKPDGRTVYVLDLENNLTGEGQMTVEQAAAFVSEIHDRFHIWPILYVNTSSLNAADAASLAVLQHCPLWIANNQEPPRLPQGFDSWLFQQYAQENKLDVDRFNGTLDALKLFWATHAAGGAVVHEQMGVRLGLHIHQGSPQAESIHARLLDYARTGQLKSVTVINDFSLANAFVQAGCPSTVLRVVRTDHDPSSPIQGNAGDYERGMAYLTTPFFWDTYRQADSRVYLQYGNEENFKSDNQFYLGLMAAAEREGRRIVCFNDSVGATDLTFDLSGQPLSAQWARRREALIHARDYGHLVGLHSYGWIDGQFHPVSAFDADGAWRWYGGRFEYLYKSMPDVQPPLLITECGPGKSELQTVMGYTDFKRDVRAFESRIANLAYVVGYNWWTVGGQMGYGYAGDSLDAWVDAMGELWNLEH